MATKIVISHPTGNRNLRAILSALLHNDMLGEFATTIAVRADARWLNLMPAGIKQELMRRNYPVPADITRPHPLLEMARIVLPKIGLRKITKHETGLASVDAVYHNLDKAVASSLAKHNLNDVKGVYNYEDGALATFTAAKKLGLKCIYDLPIAYWETGRKLMKEEAERLPGWASTLGGGILDSQAKIERKVKELELADVVVGPGKFVMDSLPEWATAKKRIVSPFGSPELFADLSLIEAKSTTRPLRVLFVGSMGQRKGLGDLFAAIKRLNRTDVELVVMGSLNAPIGFYKKELNNFKYEAGRPHAQVLELMRSCDVFCLPSIVEGRALVMQEAMSQGLPLIITPNTGGEDLIEEGVTGFLVPIRSAEVIADRINWFADNRQKTIEMGMQACNYSMKYTWNKYGQNIADALKIML